MTNKATPPKTPVDPNFIRVEITYLRNVGSIEPQPNTPDDGGNWFLRYMPKDGQPVRVLPGECMFLETGIAINVPKGYEARVSTRYSDGKPNLWLPALDIQGNSTSEVVIPFRNVTKQVQNVRPGEEVFRLVVTEPVRAYLLPD